MRRSELRRESALRERQFRERESEYGGIIYWYALDHDAVVSDSVYDESGEKTWHPRANVPIFWAFDEESGDLITPEGRELRRMLEFAVRLTALQNAGITPDPDLRLGDILQWEDQWWEVSQFTAHSQLLPSQSLGNTALDATARVTAIRRYFDYDMPLDFMPVDAEEVPRP